MALPICSLSQVNLSKSLRSLFQNPKLRWAAP